MSRAAFADNISKVFFIVDTAVFSGSFNPLHIGHLAILRVLAGLYDRVLLVISPVNPLKPSATADDAAERLRAARKALARHPELNSPVPCHLSPDCPSSDAHGSRSRVEVSDIEFSLPLPNYTINTLDALKARSPQDGFTLVVGGDQIADFRRWRDYGRILTDYGIAVFPREGFDIAEAAADLLRENPRYRIRLIDMPPVNVSSTRIREARADGLDVSGLLM